MNNFWIILSHTYITKFKSKSFLVTTILTIAIVFGLTNIQHIIHTFDKNGGKDTVAVLDQTGHLYKPLQQQIQKVNKDITLSPFKVSQKRV